MSTSAALFSWELILGVLSLALLLAKNERKLALTAAGAGGLMVTAGLGAQFILNSDALSMSSASLIATVVTAMVTVTGIRTSRPLLVSWAFIFGLMHGLSAYEVLFVGLDGVTLLVAGAYPLACWMLTATYLSKFEHRLKDPVLRVTASWTAAAGTLMLAFFF